MGTELAVYFIISDFLVEHGFFYHSNPHLEIVLQHNNVTVPYFSRFSGRNDQLMDKFLHLVILSGTIGFKTTRSETKRYETKQSGTKRSETIRFETKQSKTMQSKTISCLDNIAFAEKAAIIICFPL